MEACWCPHHRRDGKLWGWSNHPRSTEPGPRLKSRSVSLQSFHSNQWATTLSNKDLLDEYGKHLSQIHVQTLGEQNIHLRNHFLTFMIKTFLKAKQNWCVSRVSEDVPSGAIVLPSVPGPQNVTSNRPEAERNKGNEESLTTLSVLKTGSGVIYLHLPRILGRPSMDKWQILSIKSVRIMANVTEKDLS